MSWSAKQYVAFENERNRPIRDLLAAVPDIDARTVVDMGCGPGNSTEALMARFSHAAASGFDSSPDMIEAARKRLPQVHFEIADINAWNAPGPFDVILANAVFQWLPDHASLFPALVAKLSPGGSLAVQMPDNLEEPAHRLMREVAADGPWAGKLSEVAKARTPMASPVWYFELLRSCGAQPDVWRTTYHHALAGGAQAVVEWFKGSGLRPFLEPLTEDQRLAFLERYKTEVAQAYPALPDGTVLLPFPRLFVIGVRQG
ncbi:trans-aconitate 2-methyltransferase [Caballeronia udeis]|uniref:Trans-aconitate 2-methyltransferase n=1 Tax=Caballeronia udeis TaxID=1232866 RepID=A0ABW8MWR7_9BURK